MLTMQGFLGSVQLSVHLTVTFRLFLKIFIHNLGQKTFPNPTAILVASFENFSFEIDVLILFDKCYILLFCTGEGKKLFFRFNFFMSINISYLSAHTCRSYNFIVAT